MDYLIFIFNESTMNNVHVIVKEFIVKRPAWTEIYKIESIPI